VQELGTSGQPNYSAESPQAFVFWAFPEASWGGEFKKEMQIVFPEKPLGSSDFVDANEGNTSSGVGGLLAKGYFFVTITGTGSLGPPGVRVAELTPVLPP
jgi:hypothetical protein